MRLEIKDKSVETNEQGYLHNFNTWSEDVAYELARRDDIKLYIDHWELIWYFRDYYKINLTHPTMHMMVTTLGKKGGRHFHDQKTYEDHIYGLFPTDPIHELCKLAGLPMPEPDT